MITVPGLSTIPIPGIRTPAMQYSPPNVNQKCRLLDAGRVVIEGRVVEVDTLNRRYKCLWTKAIDPAWNTQVSGVNSYWEDMTTWRRGCIEPIDEEAIGLRCTGPCGEFNEYISERDLPDGKPYVCFSCGSNPYR